MVQSLTARTTFDDFITWYPENAECHYELRRGVIIEMPKPRGRHSRIAGDLAFDLGMAIRQAELPYFIPKECIVKTTADTGYEPDVIVLDGVAVATEPCWESASVIENGSSIKLLVEIVSTNWQDDYAIKLTDYEALGVQEYWVVDYLGLGGRIYIGYPKRPTLSVYSLTRDREYEVGQFRGNEQIFSPTFPTLQLTAEQIFGGK
jgi:Uma2 family endonuclease